MSNWLLFHKTCLSRPYPFKFFKGCLPQILCGPFIHSTQYFVPFLRKWLLQCSFWSMLFERLSFKKCQVFYCRFYRMYIYIYIYICIYIYSFEIATASRKIESYYEKRTLRWNIFPESFCCKCANEWSSHTSFAYEV